MVNRHDSMEMKTRCSQYPNKQMLQVTPNLQTRGHNLKLYKQQATGVRAHFFGARVVDDWNNLSYDTVNATSVNRFKSSLNRDWAQLPGKYQYTFSK